jgi:hypothetical protein
MGHAGPQPPRSMTSAEKEPLRQIILVSRERRTHSLSFASNINAASFCGAERLDSMPIEARRASTARELLVAVCFLTAIGVAMLGWLAGFAWAAVSLLMLFF